MNGAPTALPDDLRERLAWARGVLADVAHHPDHVIVRASEIVRHFSQDPNERREAGAMIMLIMQKRLRATASDAGRHWRASIGGLASAFGQPPG